MATTNAEPSMLQLAAVINGTPVETEMRRSKWLHTSALQSAVNDALGSGALVRTRPGDGQDIFGVVTTDEENNYLAARGLVFHTTFDWNDRRTS